MREGQNEFIPKDRDFVDGKNLLFTVNLVVNPGDFLIVDREIFARNTGKRFPRDFEVKFGTAQFARDGVWRSVVQVVSRGERINIITPLESVEVAEMVGVRTEVDLPDKGIQLSCYYDTISFDDKEVVSAFMEVHELEV